MAVDFFNPNASQSDAFNYNTKTDKTKRKRQLAQMLMDQSMQQERTQTVPGGPNGFVVPTNRWAPLTKMLMAYMGASKMNEADQDQQGVDKRSQDELVSALNDRPWEQRARDAQIQNEADAELLRESRRGQAMDAGETVQAESPAESFPVRAPQIETTNLPPTPVTGKAKPPTVASKLMGMPTMAGQGAYVNPGDINKIGTQTPNLGVNEIKAANKTLGQKLSADDVALVSSVMGRAPIPAAAAGAPARSSSVSPRTPVQATTGGPMPASMTTPQAPATQHGPQTTAPAVGLDYQGDGGPHGDSRSMVDQAAAKAAPTKADVIQQIVRISNTGPLGQQLAQQQLAQMFGRKAGTMEFKEVNGKLIALDPRTGQNMVVYADPDKAAAEQNASTKATREKVTSWGEQRRVLNEAQARVGEADGAITNLSKTLELAKDVGIRGYMSQKWNQVSNVFKENPKYAALNFVASDGLLNAAQSLKGAMSDKDLQFITKSRPGADSTVQEWLLYAEQALPMLQRAQAKAQKLYGSELRTARELGIPEYMQDVDEPSAPSKSTRFDWKR